jgi:hypothetical protein
MARTGSWRRARGLIDASGWLTDAGRERPRPISAALDAAGSR